MEITARDAEISCTCACDFVLFPVQSCSLFPSHGWGSPDAAGAEHQHWQALGGEGDNVAPALLGQDVHGLGFASSLLIPAPCVEHRHCWEPLSLNLALLSWGLLSNISHRVCKVLPGESSLCAIALRHTQKILSVQVTIGWYSVSGLVRVLNTGEPSTHGVCGFWWVLFYCFEVI